MKYNTIYIPLLLLTINVNAENVKKKLRPNIIFILTDDHRYDAMSFINPHYTHTPNIDRLRNEGVHFKNAYTTISLSGPSRACILTGCYSHINGVTGNARRIEFDNNRTPSFSCYLQNVGYETAFIGKWHMAHDASPRPGWDFWVSFVGQGNYYGNDLNVNGEIIHTDSYITSELNEYALKFIQKQNNDHPFMLYLSHKAVHEPFTPEEQYTELFNNVEIPRPIEANDDLATKPDWQRADESKYVYYDRDGYELQIKDKINPNTKEHVPSYEAQKDQNRALITVDDGIGSILKLLEEKEMLDNTLIVYGGDNGFLHGEHNRTDKRVAYDESIRVPLVMRYPEKIKAGSTIEELVIWLDIAPTFLDLAGAESAPQHQGKSLVQLFDGKNSGWRNSFLYTYWKDLIRTIPTMTAVVTKDYTYIEYPEENEDYELYDRISDPHEMVNLYNDPESFLLLKQMQKEMKRLKRETGYIIKVPRPDKDPSEEYKKGTLWNMEFNNSNLSRIPNSKELDPSKGCYCIDIEVIIKKDGVIMTHSNSKLGYAIYSDNNGHIGIVHSDGGGRKVFIDSPISSLDQSTSVRFEIDNFPSKLRMYQNGQLIQEKDILLPLNISPNTDITLGRESALDPENTTGKAFTGKINKLLLSRK